MAIRKSNRSTPGFARAPDRRRSQSVGRRSRANASKVPTNLPFEQLRDLTALAVRLRMIYGTAITAELALRQQAAEQDAEIADCLREGLSNAISRVTDKLDELVRHYGKEVHRTKA